MTKGIFPGGSIISPATIFVLPFSSVTSWAISWSFTRTYPFSYMESRIFKNSLFVVITWL